MSAEPVRALVGPTLGIAAMSGIRSRHLERRCGIFGVRVRVPDDIRPLVGLVEVRRSLRTSDPLTARAQSALIAVRLFEVFEMGRQQSNQVTQEYVRQLIGEIFLEMGRSVGADQTGLQNRPNAVSVLVQVPAGPTLSEAVDNYLHAKKASWMGKTFASRVRKLGFLCECLGRGTALTLISADDVRRFRDAISRFRVHKGLRRPETFASRQTEIEADRIDPKTAGLIFETAKAFFRWCKAEQGYIASNPAEDIRMAVARKRKGKKGRRPFTPRELEKLFSSPLFTGCQSRARRFEPGSLIVQDGKRWLPILGYYTGARLGELVQLHIRDVDFSQSAPCLHITEEHSGKPGTTDAKHVKSDAGVRTVPLHPDLIELGFERFVDGRRNAERPSRRLFHEVNFGSDGQASTVFSKFFARLLDKVGLPDPALVFHSFRHGAEDAFRNGLQPQYVIDRIIGHSDGSTSAGYGQGVSLAVAHAAVSAMKLEVSIPRLWAKSANSTLARENLRSGDVK